MLQDLMDKIVSLSKRRGFIFPSSEIYGGFSSCYDYGPIGVELKNNIKKAWWDEMVKKREDVIGLDASILMNPKVWQASGHLTAGFADPLVECKKCKRRFRLDDFKSYEIDSSGELLELTPDEINKSNIEAVKCPKCGESSKLTLPRKFNLMMQTYAGPVEDSASKVYLRAETCQGIYVNFKNVLDSMHLKLPFGIAQIGKAFRNEITPGNFTFRMREFEQMEMQYFIKPKDNKKWFDYWKKERMKWYESLGLNKDKIYFHKQDKDELAHYAKAAEDIYYKFPFSGDEIEGIHDRGDWDLANHTKHSKQDLTYFDDKSKKEYIPNIIETSAGADRSTLMFLVDAYHEEEVKGQKRVVLKLHSKIAPIKAAILPLARNKKEITDKAREIFNSLKDHFMVMYDETGSIGKLYRRQDEIGTPYCVTVDFDSLKDKKVTVRDRDSMKQERINIEELKNFFNDKLGNV